MGDVERIKRLEEANMKLEIANGRLKDEVNNQDMRIRELEAAYDKITGIAVDLCRACGFSMVDASGEVV